MGRWAVLRLKEVKNLRQRALERGREDKMKGWRGGEWGRGRGAEDDVLEAGTSAFSPNTAQACLRCPIPAALTGRFMVLLCMCVYACVCRRRRDELRERYKVQEDECMRAEAKGGQQIAAMLHSTDITAPSLFCHISCSISPFILPFFPPLSLSVSSPCSSLGALGPSIALLGPRL